MPTTHHTPAAARRRASRSVALGAGALLMVAAAAPVRAQSTVSMGSLFLSSGSETQFRLFGADGGVSDRIDVNTAFNFSSAGTYDFGFSHGDTVPLQTGMTFTLVTFRTTNFTDPSVFRPVSRGSLRDVQGTFLLNQPANPDSRGSLMFVLGSFSEIPEPAALPLALSAAGPLAAVWAARRRGRAASGAFTPRRLGFVPTVRTPPRCALK